MAGPQPYKVGVKILSTLLNFKVLDIDMAGPQPTASWGVNIVDFAFLPTTFSRTWQDPNHHKVGVLILSITHFKAIDIDMAGPQFTVGWGVKIVRSCLQARF